MALFDYDEEHAFLSINYNQKRHEIMIRGGWNGFASLIETYSIFAEIDVEVEDYYWHDLAPGDLVLMLVMDNRKWS